jgi:hypothetical protein
MGGGTSDRDRKFVDAFFDIVLDIDNVFLMADIALSMAMKENVGEKLLFSIVQCRRLAEVLKEKHQAVFK